MKVNIGTVMVLTVAGAAIVGGAGYLLLDAPGGRGTPPEPRYTTQAALLGATPVRAADTLRARGFALRAPLVCRDLPGATRKNLRLTCSGSTTGKRRVQVIASAEVAREAQFFTILVNGRPLVQNVSCLGADCSSRRAGSRPGG